MSEGNGASCFPYAILVLPSPAKKARRDRKVSAVEFLRLRINRPVLYFQLCP